MIKENTEGRAMKTILETKDNIFCERFKEALSDIVPIDTALSASMTSIGLAGAGSIHLYYKDGSKDVIDVGAGYGYFLGGSRTVSSAFRSRKLTELIKEIIDGSEYRAHLYKYPGSFSELAGDSCLGKQIEISLVTDKEVYEQGEDIRVKMVFINKGEAPVTLYGYCGLGDTVTFELKDMFDRPRFSFPSGLVESKKPQEKDFVFLHHNESYSCTITLPGEEYKNTGARYFGRYYLRCIYENISRFEDYTTKPIAGEFITISCLRSIKLALTLVRNWNDFQKAFESIKGLPLEQLNREIIASRLGVPDNRIPDFKDEKGQPFSDEYMALSEWIYEQPFVDKDGKRMRVTIKFQNDEVIDIIEEK